VPLPPLLMQPPPAAVATATAPTAPLPVACLVAEGKVVKKIFEKHRNYWLDAVVLSVLTDTVVGDKA
jgi:hypothetical protein